MGIEEGFLKELRNTGTFYLPRHKTWSSERGKTFVWIWRQVESTARTVIICNFQGKLLERKHWAKCVSAFKQQMLVHTGQPRRNSSRYIWYRIAEPESTGTVYTRAPVTPFCKLFWRFGNKNIYGTHRCIKSKWKFTTREKLTRVTRLPPKPPLPAPFAPAAVAKNRSDVFEQQ